MARVRIALCQLNPVVGDLDNNAAKVIEAVRRAEEQGADLAVFPELVLPGYPPEDLLVKPAFVEGNMAALEKVAAATGSCAAVVGYVDSDGDLYNAAAVAAGGKVHGSWRKQLLPNYGVFDEQRWFRPGSGEDRLFLVAGVRTGVVICEDAWSPSGPVARLGAGGAELIVVINASPYRAGALMERRRMLATRAADASTALVYVNLVGGQDELVFDGGSMVFDHHGSLVASLPQFEERVGLLDLELRPAYRKRLLDPRGRAAAEPIEAVVVSGAPAERTGSHEPVIAPAPSRAEEVYGALVLATRDYVEKNGFSDVLVSLSGGIDSSLVAVIAVDAIGAERVHGVLLPSRYSSKGSVDDAEDLVHRLGIEARAIPIEPAHSALMEMLAPSFEGRPHGLAEENLQARIRGTVVMGLSNEFGWLVLTTGNKSEMAVGYATLYGDMAGGFAVIKDVPKTLLYELCRYRNEAGSAEVIPEAVIVKPPSAELRPGQVDEDSLPPYEELDPILYGYVEEDRTISELVAEGHEAAVVRRVVDLVDRAEYKRRQAAPGPRVTSRAFGKDRRMPITNRFRGRSEPPGSSRQSGL
ncbi:MAG: NAD+ synthase [Actinomycetota bacterium]|nr:NAD+ synthase [Actinomycetota bacterium]